MNYQLKKDYIMRTCYTVVLGKPAGENIGVIKEGETGYYRTDFNFGVGEEAEKKVRLLNDNRNISEAEQLAMEIGSLVGFDSPACDILKEVA
jgi:hypothetical protein